MYATPGESVKDTVLDPEVLPYEHESIVQQFMQKKITKKIGIANIVLTHWYLKGYVKNSKLYAFFIFLTAV